MINLSHVMYDNKYQYFSEERVKCEHLWIHLVLSAVVFILTSYLILQCVGEANQYRHSSSKRVKVDNSLASTKSYPDTEFHVHWYYGYWVTWVQLEKEEEEKEEKEEEEEEEEEKKKKNSMDKTGK